MKHRQVTAVLLSIILAASASVPIDALGAYAAESAGSTATATVMEQDEAEAEEQSGSESDIIVEQATVDLNEDDFAAGSSEAADASAAEDDDASDTADGAAETAGAADDTAGAAGTSEESKGAPAEAVTPEDAGAEAATGAEAAEAATDAEAATGAEAKEAATGAEATAAASTASDAATELPPLIEIIYGDGVTAGSSREAMGASDSSLSAEDILSRQIIQTDVSTASSGCAMVGLPGEYISEQQEALARINEIRWEACTEGVLNPDTGKPLTTSDYVAIKWSSDLEYIARIRAAESFLTGAHERTSGKDLWGIRGPGGNGSYGEVLAWNWGRTMTEGIEQWYGEKTAWVNQTAGAKTGHYTSMIDPSNRYVGLGTFYSEEGGFYNTTAGEFSSKSGLAETPMSFTGECLQMLEVKVSNLSAEGEIVGKLGGELGEKSKHLLATEAGYAYPAPVYLMKGVTWSSSDTSAVAISSDGETTIKGLGRAVIKASFGNGSVTAEAEFVKRVEACTIDLSPTSYTYDGKKKEPAVTVKYDGVKLTKGTDYTLSYSNNVNAGTAKVTVSGIGEYGGTAEKTFKIDKAEQPLACAQHPLIMEFGTTEEITVTGAQTTLSFETRDADVATIDAAAGATGGTITAIAPGSTFIIAQSPANDNYKAGFLSIYVQVEKAGIYNADITVTDTVYDGTPKTPAVEARYAGKTLKEGTDYTLTCDSNTNAGTYYVTIKGIGDFQYSTRKSYKILKADQTFTAKNMSLRPYESAKATVTGAQGTLTYSSANTTVATVSKDGTVTAAQAGTAQITVSAAETGNYNAGSAKMTVTVTAYDLSSSDCTATLKTNSYVYNATARKPAVSFVKFGDVTLTEGTDYTVSYKNNTNVGTASVVISGNNKTTKGSKTLNFTITKAKQTITAENMSLHPYETAKVKVTGALGSLTYKSSNTAVATVSEDGTVTAVQAGTAGQAGTAQITVSAVGTDNYNAGSAKMTVTVTAYDLSSSDCIATLKTSSYTYNGKARKPAVASVKFGDVTLTEGTDYTVSYKNNTNAGTASVVITGNNKTTTGSKTLNFTITKAKQTITAKDISLRPYEQAKVTVTGAKGALTYKSENTAVATVAEDGTVTAVQAGTTGLTGTAQITVSAAETDNYSAGSTKLTVTVTAYDLSSSECVATLKTNSYVYNGKARKPAVASVKFGDVTLTEGTDYTVSYKNNTNAGNASVVITGNNKTTTGTKTLNFTITKAEQTVTAENMSLRPYEKAKVAVTGAKGTLTYKSANTAVAAVAADGTVTAGQPGTAGQPATAQITVSAAETDNYKAGSAKMTVTVTAYDLSSSECVATLKTSSYTYNGKARKPAVASVKFGDVTLTEGTDYTVSYKNNTNAGTASVVITGNNKTTTGSKTLSFTITKAKQTITAKDISLRPYEQAKVEVTGAKGALTYKSENTAVATVAEDGTVTAVQAGTAGQAGTAQITVSAAETDNYSAGSATLTVTVTAYDLSSSDCTAELKTNSYVYNGTARKPAVSFVKFGDVTLTAKTDYTVSYKNNTNAGTASVVITGNNKTTTGSKTLSFTITKAEQTLSADGLKIQEGESAKVVVTGAQGTLTYKIADPSIATVADDGTVTAVAEGTTKLMINAAQTGNYKAAKAIEIDVEVTKIALPGKTTRGDMFNLANNVKVTWKEVAGAKYYKVYREGVTDPSESLDEPVIVTTGLIGWDKQPGLTNGHAYRYRIVASLTGAGDSSGDSPLSYSKLMYRLKTVVIRSVKNTAPGKVTVKYDKTTSGDSYVLQYCEREDMVGAKTKVVLGAENTSYVIGGLKKGKTYYISIRVRKKVDGIDYYTTFGVAKKVTITQ